MKSTTDYGIFKDFTSNRELNTGHLKSLTEAIRKRNLLHVNPIIVTKEMKVIDGQHRLEAAKNLSAPIYYIEADLTRQDISKLNSHQKNWNMMDYLNFYQIEGHQGFIDFVKFYNHHRKFKISSLLILTNSERRRNLKELKEGILMVDSLPEAEEVCQFCEELSNKYDYDFVFDSRFSPAVRMVMDAEGFNIDILKEKIKAAPRNLVRCHTFKEYAKMLEEIYNYKLSKNTIKV